MQQYPVVGDMDLVGCRVLNHTDTSATHMKPIARVRDDEFLCPYDKPVCVSLRFVDLIKYILSKLNVYILVWAG